MSKTKDKNERIKRKYLNWLQEAEGFSEKSITAVEKALWKYEEFTKDADYSTFNHKIAEQFKKFLATNKNKISNKTLSLRSQYHILRHVRNFLVWLSGQSGYKSRISTYDVQYLQLSKKDRRVATSASLPKYPTLEQIKQLCSFSVQTELDQRDRALIAFTALTGMRDQAIITLPLGCFDQEKMLVQQLPSKGVQTKFSKDIYTTLFQVDETLVGYFLKWYNYLKTEKHFGLEDPMFPSTEVGFVGKDHHAFTPIGIGKSFWADTNPMRKIFQERSKQTSVPYYTPHKFRHFIINEAQKHITSIEQLKALSQNLGHENISTTFHGYGAIDTYRVNELVSSIDFSGMPQNREEEAQLEKIANLVAKKLGRIEL